MNLLASISGTCFIILTAAAIVNGIGNLSESFSFDFDPPASLTSPSVKKSALSANVERAVVLTRAQGLEIVKRHNDLRTKVKPSAKKMRKFTWNDELADIATKYSRKCIYEHNKARKHSRFSYIGENLYISMGIPWSTNLVTNAVSAWDAEKEDYDYKTRKCKPGKKCGHYTQTAWDDTFKVGCGVTICRRITVNGRIWTSATLFACNYGPGGNFPRHPFVAGPSCSDCNTGAGDVCEKNLCTNPMRDVNFDVVVAEWNEWSQWSTCSKTCLGGFATRQRTCNTFVNADCTGYSLETTFSCATDFCNTNIPGITVSDEFHPWGSWSECSVTCGGGVKRRTRRCKKRRCSGFNQLSLRCNEATCPAVRPTKPKGTWSSWGQWSECSVTCGAGRRKQKRRCSGENCAGRSAKTKRCNAGLCIGVWDLWSSWTKCSATCGGGSRVRARRCRTGANCIGASEMIQNCNTQMCGSVYSAWSQWSQCSQSCGPGRASRSRTCITGENCNGRRIDRRSCNEGICPEFNEWSTWSACDVTCGLGSKSRSRLCNGRNSDECVGKSSEIKKCTLPDCLNPGWNFWSAWNSCNVTCGSGWRTSERTCQGSNPGSSVCPGESVRTRQCQRRNCPEFSTWSQWSRCSTTCGDGTRIRTRKCQFGRGCVGKDTQNGKCMIRRCIKTSWGEWEDWSECSEPCGEGIHTRIRFCHPGTDGITACSGENDESRKCKLKSCEGDGSHASILLRSRLYMPIVAASIIVCAHI